MSAKANWFCVEPEMNRDSRLAFGRTICLLVSFKILFYLDAQIWQWHELQLSASGRRGTSQVKLFQPAPLGEPRTTHTRAKRICIICSFMTLRFCCIPSNILSPVCFVTNWLNRLSECVSICLSGGHKAYVWQLEWTPWHFRCYPFNPVKSQQNAVQPSYKCRLQYLLQVFRPPTV